MQPIFVGGCGRSGTTLLAAQLGRRPGVVVPPEAQFLVQGLGAQATGGDFAAAVTGSWRLGLWELGADDLRAADMAGRPPAAAMTRLVEAYARRHDRPDAQFWVDHTPANIVHARTVLELFPQAHLIHLIRDPRGVVASILPLDWGPATPREAARWWLGRIAAGLAAESAYPQRVHRVRFEDLVADPDAVLDPVAERLGLAAPADAAAASAPLAGYTRAQHRLVGAPPDPSRSAAWRDALTPAQIAMVESEVGDCLPLLGYEPVTTARFARTTVGLGEAVESLTRKTGKKVRGTLRRRRFGARGTSRRGRPG